MNEIFYTITLLLLLFICICICTLDISIYFKKTILYVLFISFIISITCSIYIYIYVYLYINFILKFFRFLQFGENCDKYLSMHLDYKIVSELGHFYSTIYHTIHKLVPRVNDN